MKSACPSMTYKETVTAGKLATGPTPPPTPMVPTPPPPPTPSPPPCSSPVIEGELTIMYNGSPKIIYIANANKGGISVNGKTLKIEHGPRVYFADKCTQNMDPNMYWNPNYLGSNLSYTVDLSGVGCACNAAMYLISMPARNPDGTPVITKCGDYYCDANYVCGPGCPEVDIQEANNHAWAFTPHKCDRNGQAYSNCDRGGCGAKAGSYGPGQRIDTNRPIDVHVGFTESGGRLVHTMATFKQGGNTVTITPSCDGGYLQNVGEALKAGMTIAISNWGTDSGTMSWLDIPPCGGESCNNGAAIFSNFEFGRQYW